LVAQEDAELEEGGVAAADLGQAYELRVGDGDFVGREGAITGGQENFGHCVVAGLEVGNVSSGLIYFDSAGL
jgi:hypothetical protein